MESLMFLLILILCSRVTSDCQDQHINILLNVFPPYVIKKEDIRTTRVDELIEKCPQKCRNVSWIGNKTALIDHIDEVKKGLHGNTTMFAFPIPVEYVQEIRQHYPNDNTVQVIPSQDKSSLILLVDIRICREELSSEIFQIIQKQSPILPIMLLLAAIAGIILWVLEARHNDKEFSSSFFRGTFDGFWWAFISMTTVGYGDKTPRTVLGRVFGMIWITMGVVIISFFTATIASAITIATVEKSCHMLKNRNVAIISNAEVKEYVKGQDAKSVKEFDNFPAMFEALRSKKDGINSLFVEEHVALMYFYGKDHSEIKDVRVFKTIKEVKQIQAKITLFYSVVVKNPHSKGLPCGFEKTNLKEFLPDLPKPPDMFKTGFEEEVDQPLSIGSPETVPALITLSGVFGILAVSGYIGIHIMKCKKKDPKFDKVEASSQEMESNPCSKRRILQLQQSLNLIVQEVKEMRKVLDSNNA